MKLVKTEKRNRLKDITLEAILVIWSSVKKIKREDRQDLDNEIDFDSSKNAMKFDFKATEKMLVLFDSVIDAINSRKSQKRKIQEPINIEDNLPITNNANPYKRVLTTAEKEASQISNIKMDKEIVYRKEPLKN